MAFEDRLNQADALVDTLATHLWSLAPLASRILVVPYGYETHTPSSVRQALRYARSITAKFVRFTPDFFVIDLAKPGDVYLLEYKTTQTPLYSRSRIRVITSNAGGRQLDWDDIGQMEADAYDNYTRLGEAGVRVAVVNYCAYHTRPLLCEYIERINALYRDNVRSGTQLGSRTPFVNFDCKDLRTLFDFVRDEHGLAVDENTQADICYRLAQKLPVRHHPNSPLNGKAVHS